MRKAKKTDESNLRKLSKHRQKVRRKRKKEKLRRGQQKFHNDVRRRSPRYRVSRRSVYDFERTKSNKKPKYSERIEYFKSKKQAFDQSSNGFNSSKIKIPGVFSLIDNYSETCIFLNKLFNELYKQTHRRIVLDYKDCHQIDVGASICMDIILSDFIEHFEFCHRTNYPMKVEEISPINYERYEIEKILFSIGAFRNIRGFSLDFPNIITFPMRVGNNQNPKIPSLREVDITKTVDYIVASLGEMNKKLTDSAETNLYKVIGEVMQNADEHSNLSKRYSIGYFEHLTSDSKEYGVFNLAILNFGNTIYETFLNPDCNESAKKEMEMLSEQFTRKNFFKKAEFEEETLWTLYSLQDGITRKNDWKRGNGSIRFIESFFNLKGNDETDPYSKMVITSGRTRIIFDGKYEIVEKPRGSKGEIFKMMTFNETGNIEELPDPEFVKFEQNYFPGTLFSARIRIDYENTENFN